MVILGLGSNLGNRITQLRRALNVLKQLPTLSIEQVSPIYISDALLPENAPFDWDTPYLNCAIRCKTSLSPLALLKKIKDVEKSVGRTPEKIWGPRMIDIDILAWDNLIQYDKNLHIPHEHLLERPFALWPLADVAPRWIYPLPGLFEGKTAAELVLPWGSRFDGNAPLHTKQIPHRIDTSALVGVLNITPDSFSENGKNHFSPYALVEAGAEILDIGAEATGPHATPISSATEWERLEPILKLLLKERSSMQLPPKISVDTRHADTAEKALNLGVDWINDVSGLSNPAMCALLKNHACDIVMMHHRGIPVSNQKSMLASTDNPVSIVYEWAKEQISTLDKRGISCERLILDPGIGFGKSAAHSFELIKHISEFKKLGIRLLVGHSRKSFLNLFTEKIFSERDLETAAISLYLSNQSVDYLRLHNIEMNSRILKLATALS